MTDIALFWDPENFVSDIAVNAGALEVDEGLRTAILISLFTDARARPDDVLPTPDADPRGWWGNAFPQDISLAGDELGSRLWLLSRSKTTPDVIARARDYAREAVQWLLDDGVAEEVTVEAERQGDATMPRIAIGIEVTRPGRNQPTRYDFVWEALA